MSTWTVHSVSIPSHHLSSSSSSSPHVLYKITTTTSPSQQTYTVHKRYSDFEKLDKELCRVVGESNSPARLPPKHKFASMSRLFGCGTTTSFPVSPETQDQDDEGGGVRGTVKGLNQDDLVQRRMGLERYLKTIVGSRDTRWSTCEPLREFLLGSSASQVVSSSSSSNENVRGGEREWTAAGWTNESQAVEEEIRQIKDKVGQRDKLVQDKRSEVHKLTSELKKSLVELVRRIGSLAEGLKQLSEKGRLADGEIQRRGDVVQRLQDELSRVGQAVNDAPRVGLQTSSSAYDRQQLMSSSGGNGGTSSSSSRGTLNQPARVLGSSASRQHATETSETRPLDNASLLQLQQTYIQDQDSKLDSLTAALRRQRVLGEMIHQELNEHDEVLNDIDKGTDRVKGKIKAAEKQMKKL
ncbi:hypothetical protein ACM66B_001250 [Microbotryomycetes sp. NB124-2]